MPPLHYRLSRNFADANQSGLLAELDGHIHGHLHALNKTGLTVLIFDDAILKGHLLNNGHTVDNGNDIKCTGCLIIFPGNILTDFRAAARCCGLNGSNATLFDVDDVVLVEAFLKGNCR